MAIRHDFHFSKEWGWELSEEAPVRGRVPGGLVRENDELVASGSGLLKNGEKIIVSGYPPTERIVPPREPAPQIAVPQFETTNVTVADMDSLSAALALGDGAAVLCFAHASRPGGLYRDGFKAQEECLCLLLPQLIHSLESVAYPIKASEGECLVTQKLMAVRQASSYKLCHCQGFINILAAAMPCGDAGIPGEKLWTDTVNLRIRGVLHAAKSYGFAKLVLGAWGCGAHGNPPQLVARLFREQLISLEFRGAFRDIVFAIIDASGDGNWKPFSDEISKIADAGPYPSVLKVGAQKTFRESEPLLPEVENDSCSIATTVSASLRPEFASTETRINSPLLAGDHKACSGSDGKPFTHPQQVVQKASCWQALLCCK